MKINLRVNGSEKEFELDRIPHLEALVQLLVQSDKGLLAEVNETLIHREKWREHTLKNGDCVELISLVGGG